MKPAEFGPFKNGLLKEYSDGFRHGFQKTNDSGNAVPIPCRFDAYCILDGFNVALKANDKWGIVNYKNQKISPFIYDIIEKPPLSDSVAYVMKDGKWGLMSSEGKVLSPLEYDHIKLISTKLLCRRSNDNRINGFERTQFVFTLFRQGIVSVYNDKGDVIRNNGIDNANRLLQCGDQCLIAIEDHKKIGLIDTNGTVVLDCQYDEFQPLQGIIKSGATRFRFLNVRQGNLWGVLGENCKFLLKCQFEGIKAVGDAIALKHSDKWGVLSYSRILDLESRAYI